MHSKGIFVGQFSLPVCHHLGVAKHIWLGGGRKRSFLLPPWICPSALLLLPRPFFSTHQTQYGASSPIQNVPACTVHWTRLLAGKEIIIRKIKSISTNFLMYYTSFSRLRSLMFNLLSTVSYITSWVWNGLHLWWFVHLHNPHILECNAFQTQLANNNFTWTYKISYIWTVANAGRYSAPSSLFQKVAFWRLLMAKWSP